MLGVLMDCATLSRMMVLNHNETRPATILVKAPIPTNSFRYNPLTGPFFGLMILLPIRSIKIVIICSGSFSPNRPEKKFAIVSIRVLSTG